MIAVANSIARHRPLKISTLPLLFQYYGLLMLDEENIAMAGSAFDYYFHKNLDYAYFSLPPYMNEFAESLTDWQRIKVLNLFCDREILSRWGTDFLYMVKKQIKKAKRNGIIVERIDNIPMEIWRKAFERKYLATPIHSEQLARWSRQLIDKSLLNVYAAKIEGRAIAFRAELMQGKFAYDWIAGSDPEFNIMGVNQILMAEIGDYLRERNIKIWDLVGGQIKGVAEFKRSFGARDIYHYHISKSYNAKGSLYHFLREIRNGIRKRN